MNPPPLVHIGFHNMPPSPAIVARIEAEAAKLEKFESRLMSCRVRVDAPHRHHRRGHHYRIGIPGKKILIDHEPPARQVLLSEESGNAAKHAEADPTHRDAYVAIRDAFAAARRRLEDASRKRRDLKRTRGSLRSK